MENSKRINWLYVLAGLLITANIAVLAILFIHRGGHEKHREGPAQQGQLFGYLTKELNLDKQQQAAYDSLRTEHREAVKKIQDSLRTAKDALFNMLQENNATEEAIKGHANIAAALSAQLDVITYHHFQKLRALCNPGQQKKFDEVIQDAIRSMGRPQGPRAQGAPQQGPPPPQQ